MAQAIVKDLIDEIQRLSNRVSSTERGRAREALNRAMTKYAQRLPWKSLKRSEEFTTDGTRFMVFPERVASIIEIADITEQARIRPEAHFIENHGPTFLGKVGGRPCVWREKGIVPLVLAPATDTTYTFESAASETIVIELFGTVRDAAASGSALEFYEVRETISLTGSAVQSANTYVGEGLRAISKDRSTTNSVTVVDDVANKTVSRLKPQDFTPIYRRIEFDVIPGAGRQVLVEYFTMPDRIDSELQGIDPSLNIDYLVWMATGDMHWLLKETQNAQIAWQKADELIAIEANKESTFGENSNSITPDFSYMDLEEPSGF